MNRISLFEEYRLIERTELEINGAWKGAHLLLFFMAFVFGSFCTFCFHMLMYLFDEKCVLFPKLLSLTSLRHNVIYEFIPVDKETANMLPVDFVGTQWVEKSACYLPTYVPLVSGIFGLVWTTMFLMCSTGSRTLTGLQRPWRVLPPVFLFSLAMGGLCIYSSSVTHTGLNELCIKLGEITGSATCTYTVNVATLAYERRIRGVYQAIRLTILSAWLHTTCWLLSALLTLARVFLAVDFQLVRINVDLIGDIEKILEHHETQIRTVSPDAWVSERDSQNSLPVRVNSKVQFKRRTFNNTQTGQTESTLNDEEVEVLYTGKSEVLYVSKYIDEDYSEHALLPEEKERLARLAAYEKVPRDNQFIVKMVYDLVQSASVLAEEDSLTVKSSEEELLHTDSDTQPARQLGHEKLSTKSVLDSAAAEPTSTLADAKEAEETAKWVRRILREKLNEQLRTLHSNVDTSVQATSSSGKKSQYESELNITLEMKDIIEAKRASVFSERQELNDDEVPKGDIESKGMKKSNLKNISAQTDKTNKQKRVTTPKVHISEPEDMDETTETVLDAEKETQTSKKKEKQD